MQAAEGQSAAPDPRLAWFGVHVGDYLVGSAVVDATPGPADVAAGRVQLAGYVARTEPAARIAAPLTTRALVVDDTAGGRFALVTLDVCAVEHTFSDEVRRRVGDATAIPPEAVLVTVTHTHSAPVTRPFPVFSEAAAVPDPDYLARLADGAVDVAARAFDDRQPARLFVGRGSTGIGFNRHRVDGVHDGVLDVVQAVADESGDTIAIAFVHGCHPVSEPDLSVVSPDFPGAARDGVEAVFGGDALFVQGFAGTANPRPGMDVGATLAGDVGAVLAGDLVRLGGPVRVAMEPVALAVRPPPTRSAVEALHGRLIGQLDLQSVAARRWCERFLAGEAPADVRTDLVSVRVGGGSRTWRLCACSHEVVGEWAYAVRALWDERVVSLAGYTGGVDCYLPTAAILAETPDAEFPLHANYEGCTSFLYYGLATRFADSVDAELLGAVDLLDQRPRRAASWAVADGDGAVALVSTPTGVSAVEISAVGGPAVWTDLPGDVGARPVVVRAVNGVLAAFVRGAAGDVLHTWQAGPEHGWVPWVSLGGAVGGEVTALVTLDGRLAVLARGPDDELVMVAQTGALAGWSGWSTVAGGLDGDPAAAVTAGGDVVVVARGPDTAVRALVLPPTLDDSAAWEEVLPESEGVPALAPDGAGGVVIGVVDAEGGLATADYSSSSGPSTGGWGAPVMAGGALTGRPALSLAADGTTTAVARGRDGALHMARRAPGAARWGSWASLGGEFSDGPELVAVSSGALWVLAAGGDGALRAATVPARVRGSRRFFRIAPP